MWQDFCAVLRLWGMRKIASKSFLPDATDESWMWDSAGVPHFHYLPSRLQYHPQMDPLPGQNRKCCGSHPGYRTGPQTESRYSTARTIFYGSVKQQQYVSSCSEVHYKKTPRRPIKALAGSLFVTGSSTGDYALSLSRRATRRILPFTVLGSSVINSTIRGYLYGAVWVFTYS